MFAFDTVLADEFDDGEGVAGRTQICEGKRGEVEGDFEGALVFVSVGRGEPTSEVSGALIAVAGLDFH